MRVGDTDDSHAPPCAQLVVQACSVLKAMAKEKRLSTLMRKSQSLTPGKNIVPLTLKAQLTLSKKAPLGCRVLYPFLCSSSQETRGDS